LSLEPGDRPSAGLCLLWRALPAWKLTDLAQARALYAESLTLFQAMHERYLPAWVVQSKAAQGTGPGFPSCASLAFHYGLCRPKSTSCHPVLGEFASGLPPRAAL